MKKIISALVVASLALAGCSSQQPDPCLEADNPAECRQWADAGGDINDYLLYGMAGFMIGSMMSGGKKTTYIHTDPSYRGQYRGGMASRYGSKDVALQRANAKIERQRKELKRQQEANRKKNEQLKQQRSQQRKTSSSRSFGSSRPSRSFGGRRR